MFYFIMENTEKYNLPLFSDIMVCYGYSFFLEHDNRIIYII